MSLCSLTTRRVEIPHEEGAWVDLKPLSAKLLHTIGLEAARIGREALKADEFDTDAEGYAETSLMLTKAIVAWSYDAPVDQEHVDDLDLQTTVFLKSELMGGSTVPLPITSPSNESSEETLEIA